MKIQLKITFSLDTKIAIFSHEKLDRNSIYYSENERIQNTKLKQKSELRNNNKTIFFILNNNICSPRVFDIVV